MNRRPNSRHQRPDLELDSSSSSGRHRMERLEAVTDPELLKVAIEHPDPWTRYGAARNEVIDPALLRLLADDPDRGVRIFVAENPATPEPLLMWMCEHEDDPDVLHALACHPLGQVRAGAGRNPLLVASAVPEQFGDDRRNSGLETEAVESAQIRARWDAAVEAEEAFDRSTPQHRLVELSSSNSPRVRGFVARNTSAPPVVLRGLTRDPDRDVAGWARQTLRHLSRSRGSCSAPPDLTI